MTLMNGTCPIENLKLRIFNLQFSLPAQTKIRPQAPKLRLTRHRDLPFGRCRAALNGETIRRA